MATFVLVHGAWHGGWCWKEVKKLLEKNKHQVFTPTMTGLGEKKHLISNNISVDILVNDVVNLIEYENLDDIILVGHSFGGAIISAVAEQVKQKINQLVYLDAVILENNESMFNKMPEKIANERKKLAKKTSGGISFPIPSSQDLGILDKKQWRLIEKFLTPHPVSTYDTKIKLKNRPAKGFKTTYIICTNPIYEPLEWSRKRAKDYGWKIVKIDTGHDAMITNPNLLVNTLLDLSV